MIAKIAWLLVTVICISRADDHQSKCHDRCERLFHRSLQRIGEDVKHIREALQVHLKSDQSKSICWKFTDYDDCLRLCGNSKAYDKSSKVNTERDGIRRKCRRITATSPYQKHFRCVHRYHNFMQVRCSSFAQEATKYRVMSKRAKNNYTKGVTRDVLTQETCRHLHYHSMCLANAVFGYCPDADELFNRFTMRDYFLSYVVPEDDVVFTDRLLDYCQLYDFQKMAKDFFDSTKSTTKRALPHSNNVYVTHPMTMPFTTNANEVSKHTTTLFDSEEDLQDIPPNFHYSSAKYPKRYSDARSNDIYRTTNRARTEDIDSIDLITKPVSIDFSFESDVPEYTTHPYNNQQPVTHPQHRQKNNQGYRNQHNNGYSNQPNHVTHPDQGTDHVTRPNSYKHNPHSSYINQGVTRRPGYAPDGTYLQNQIAQNPEDQQVQTQVTWPDTHPTMLTIDQVIDRGDHKKGVIPSVPPAHKENYNSDEDTIDKKQLDDQIAKIKGLQQIEDDDEYDDDGPLLPFSKVHITNIKSHDDVTSDRDKFFVRQGTGRPYEDDEDYADFGQMEPVQATTLGDVFRSAISTALNPSGKLPAHHTREQANTVLLLMVAYTIFFVAALIILISLIITMVMRRKRLAYQTYIVKKPLKY